jgi:hypothetical protein
MGTIYRNGKFYGSFKEDAEVRVTGKGQILVNDEGVTFSNASGSVTFSIEELTALKNLLNS